MAEETKVISLPVPFIEITYTFTYEGEEHTDRYYINSNHIRDVKPITSGKNAGKAGITFPNEDYYVADQSYEEIVARIHHAHNGGNR